MADPYSPHAKKVPPPPPGPAIAQGYTARSMKARYDYNKNVQAQVDAGRFTKENAPFAGSTDSLENVQALSRQHGISMDAPPVQGQNQAQNTNNPPQGQQAKNGDTDPEDGSDDDNDHYYPSKSGSQAQNPPGVPSNSKAPSFNPGDPSAENGGEAGPLPLDVFKARNDGRRPVQFARAIAPVPIAGDAKDRAALFRDVGAASRPAAPAPAPAPAPSFADNYRSGSNYNTAQATKDYATGKISAGQLAQVRGAAFGGPTFASVVTPAPAAAPLGRAYGSSRILPSTPDPTREVSAYANPDGSATYNTANGGSATIMPAGADTGESAILEEGATMKPNPNRNGAPLPAAPSGENPARQYADDKAAILAEHPEVGVADSPENKRFVDAFKAGGQDKSSILALSRRIFGEPGYTSGLGGVAAAPAPLSPAAAQEPGFASFFGSTS